MLEIGSVIMTDRPTERPAARNSGVDEHALSTAELAECTCPDFCERDHETD
jgi:hypothetical protein